MQEYEVVTVIGKVQFTGRYRKSQESEHWHYYERDDGVMLHFRKAAMVYVVGGTITDLPAAVEPNSTGELP